jgi:hypothetical protein
MSTAGVNSFPGQELRLIKNPFSYGVLIYIQPQSKFHTTVFHQELKTTMFLCMMTPHTAVDHESTSVHSFTQPRLSDVNPVTPNLYLPIAIFHLLRTIRKYYSCQYI